MLSYTIVLTSGSNTITVPASDIIQDSLQYNRQHLNGLESSSQFVRVSIVGDSSSAEWILTHKNVSAVLTCNDGQDSYNYNFSGLLSEKTSWTIGSNGCRNLQVTIEDKRSLLDLAYDDDKDVYYNGTLDDLVEDIADKVGLTFGDDYSERGETSISSMISRGTTCKEVLNSACYECCTFFTVDGNLLNLRSIQDAGEGPDVEWNQLIPHEYNSSNFLRNAADVTYGDGYVGISNISATYGGLEIRNTTLQSEGWLASHKYLLMYSAKAESDSQINVYPSFNLYAGTYDAQFANQYLSNTGWNHLERIFSPVRDSSASTKYVWFFVNSGTSWSTPGAVYYLKELRLIDLTQMFGAGNEPTTVDDPRIADINAYLAEHPEYNEGTIVNNVFTFDTLTESDIWDKNGSAISVNKDIQQYDEAEVKYTVTKSLANTTIFRDDSFNIKQPHSLAAHYYYPGDKPITTTDPGTPSNIGVAYVETGKELVTFSSPIIHVNSSPTVASTCTKYDDGSVNILLKNNNNVSSLLNSLSVTADIVYVDSEERINAGVESNKKYTYEASWIHNKNYATHLVNMIQQYYEYCDYKYTFYTKRVLELGKVYTLDESLFSGIDTKVLITKVEYTSRLQDGAPLYKVSAVGYGSFNLDIPGRKESSRIIPPGSGIGIPGEDGKDGAYTEYEFAKNTSPTIAPTTGWQDAPMDVSSGEYLWMRQRRVTF